VRGLKQSLALTALNEFELLNAVRFAVFRQVLPAVAGATIIQAFETDVADGKLVIEGCNLARVLAEAKQLSMAQTMAGGHRSFDILHIAAALQLKADTFLSFDANQRALAQAAGLMVQT
jgi:predicted nucleic acid-binding protein